MRGARWCSLWWINKTFTREWPFLSSQLFIQFLKQFERDRRLINMQQFTALSIMWNQHWSRYPRPTVCTFNPNQHPLSSSNYRNWGWKLASETIRPLSDYTMTWRGWKKHSKYCGNWVCCSSPFTTFSPDNDSITSNNVRVEPAPRFVGWLKTQWHHLKG